MSKREQTTDVLAELVRKNTTEAQWDTLFDMGLIKENGHLSVRCTNLEKAEDTPLPEGDKYGVRIKGQVRADMHFAATDISLFKNQGGTVSATSNQKIKDKNGNFVISTKTGKPMMKFIPNFSSIADSDRRAQVVDAWRAFLGILPSYLKATGDL